MTDSTKNVPAISAEMRLGDHATGDSLILTFSNGRVLSVAGAEMSELIRRTATLHGLKQKLVDAAAMSRNPDTGRAASLEDKYNAVKEVFDRITSSDDWNKIREGGGGAGSLLLRALVRLYDGAKSREEIEAFLADKTPKEQAALRKNPKVAAIILDIQSESAGAGDIDSDELLGELG